MSTPAHRQWSAGRIVALVAGSFALLIGLVFTVSGGAMVVIDRTQRNADGYFMSGTDRFATGGYALATRELTVSSDIPSWILDRMGEVRIEATPVSSAPLFIGIAARSDVDAYLAGVQHDVVTGIHDDPFRADYQPQAGSRVPAAPASQPFWVASASGPSTQRVTWTVRSGNWAVVVMNAAVTPGVSVDARVGANIGILLWVGVGLLGAGVLLLALGITVVILTVRRGRSPAAGQPASVPGYGQPGQTGVTQAAAPQEPEAVLVGPAAAGGDQGVRNQPD